MKVYITFECEAEELFDYETEDGVEYDEDGVAWWFDEDAEVWYFFDEDEDDWFEWDGDEEDEEVEYYNFESNEI